MNNMNQWHEVITVLEQEGFKHEDAVLLLREADLPDPGLFEQIRMINREIFGKLQRYSQFQRKASHHTNRTATRKPVT